MGNLKKENVYVVVDTPKKAKKLKKVLDMFGEEFNVTDSNAIKTGTYKGSAKLYDAFNKAYFAGINWTLMPLAESKTEVSIKELKRILAKEHLKEGDYVVCNAINRAEFLIKIDGIEDFDFIFNVYKKIRNNKKWSQFNSLGVYDFKRYATPEEIALLEEKKELEVGRWYKSKRVNALFYLTEIKEKYRENKGFGVKNNKEWFDTRDTCTHFGKAYEIDYFTEATPQEVESALIAEAKRRYKVGDILSKLVEDIGGDERVYINEWTSPEAFNLKGNKLYTRSELGLNICIFHNGKWAEVIKNDDKFAELKEAHKNGAVIECRDESTGFEWITAYRPQWMQDVEYRIKPEEKPKEFFNLTQLTELVKEQTKVLAKMNARIIKLEDLLFKK